MNELIKGQTTLNLDTLESWTQWLHEHHLSCAVVWLRIRKSASKKPGIRLSEAVKEAIRFGWIDGQITTQDNDYFYIRFTPRGPKSVWSLINRERAQTLIDEGRMMPLGLKAVENAIVNKTWQAAYTSFDKTEIPQDLGSALEKDAIVKARFDHLKSNDKLKLIYSILTAKTDTERQTKIQRLLIQLSNDDSLKGVSKKEKK